MHSWYHPKNEKLIEKIKIYWSGMYFLVIRLGLLWNNGRGDTTVVDAY